MKVKDFLELCDDDFELTCLDRDWDCEFYLYNNSEDLFGKEFPRYTELLKYLIDNLSIVKIYNHAVAVNLYEMLDNRKVLEIAKDMYEEQDYADYDDLLELLMNDCLTNIAFGYESISETLLKALKEAYGN